MKQTTMNDSVLSSRRLEPCSAVGPLAADPIAEAAAFVGEEAPLDSRGGSRAHTSLLRALSMLRAELLDSAFDLERRPYLDAADLACVLARRIEAIITDTSAS